MSQNVLCDSGDDSDDSDDSAEGKGLLIELILVILSLISSQTTTTTTTLIPADQVPTTTTATTSTTSNNVCDECPCWDVQTVTSACTASSHCVLQSVETSFDVDLLNCAPDSVTTDSFYIYADGGCFAQDSGLQNGLTDDQVECCHDILDDVVSSVPGCVELTTTTTSPASTTTTTTSTNNDVCDSDGCPCWDVQVLTSVCTASSYCYLERNEVLDFDLLRCNPVFNLATDTFYLYDDTCVSQLLTEDSGLISGLTDDQMECCHDILDVVQSSVPGCNTN